MTTSVPTTVGGPGHLVSTTGAGLVVAVGRFGGSDERWTSVPRTVKAYSSARRRPRRSGRAGGGGEPVLFMYDRVPADSPRIDGHAGLFDLLRAWEPQSRTPRHLVRPWACLRPTATATPEQATASPRTVVNPSSLRKM
ncbi:hypothetical protein [Streptomyces sp. Qhu_M48]|uniref:hypothetical protein n=1 Tax=Streptomyces sp. Qhu_M48 TaxID=3435889 RepID=UPI003F4F9520